MSIAPNRLCLIPILAHNFQNSRLYYYFSDISQLGVVFRLLLRYNLTDASNYPKGVCCDDEGKSYPNLYLYVQSLSISAPSPGPVLERNPFLAPAPLATGSSPAPAYGAPATLPVPLIQRLYPLSYAQAEEVANAVKELFSGKIGVDKGSNSLILLGPESEHQRLATLLKELDKATKQVTLEAKIIALSKENNKSLGVNWSWDTIPQREISTEEDAESSDSSTDTYGGNFKFWRGYAFRFNATLNALISQGKAKVLAKPHIITIPGRQASIFIGDHIPVQTEKHDSGGYYTATEYLDAGIKLEYEPLLSQDGKMVTAKVHTEVSTPVLISELKNYRITSRMADTNVRMYSGQTLVIGGLISEEEQNTLQKIPFLGDLPLLGKLFSNHTKKRSKVEVMLLLTPHITDPGTSPAIFQTPVEP